MPRIPEYQNRGGIQIENPTGFQSTGAARIEGESVADFGAAITNAGSAFAKFLQQKEVDDKNLKREAANIKAQNALVQAEIYANTTGKPDKTDYFEIFNTKYEELAKDSFVGVDDEDEKTELKLIYEKNRVTQLPRLFKEAANDSIRNAKIQVDKLAAKRAHLVRLDPMKAQKLIDESDNFVEGLSGLYGPNEKEALKQIQKEEIASAAISTYMEKNDYGSARQALGQLGKYLPTEKQNQIGRSIQDEQISYRERVLRDAEKTERDYEEKKEQEKVDNGIKVQLDLMKATDPAEKERILLESENLLNTGKLSLKDYKELKNMQTREISSEQEAFESGLAIQIMDAKGKKDLLPLGVRIKEAMKAGSISPDGAEKLYRIWAQKQADQNGTSLKHKKAAISPKFKADDAVAKKEIAEAFKKPTGPLASIVGSDMEKLRIEASYIYNDKINSGMSPRDAAQIAITTVTPSPDALPRAIGVNPDNPQRTRKELADARTELKSRFERGPKTQKDKENYKEQLKRIEERRRAIEAYEIIKNANAQADLTAGGSTSAE